MEGTIGEIRMFAGNFEPKSWAFCAGQTINIASNTALFSILGTTFGGNGTTNFMLPNLQGRFPIGAGGAIPLGQVTGTETTTLTAVNLAAHTHTAVLNANAGSSTQPGLANGVASSISARVTTGGYSIQTAGYGNANSGQPMAADVVTLAPAGQNSPVSVMNPFLGMNYIICQYGIFPSRN
jgi:microcystin-dependent protein